MGFFSSSPKRITEKELKGTTFSSGIYGAMRSGEHKLTDHKFDNFKAIVSGAMDEDRSNGKNWTGITEKEIDAIKEQMKTSGEFNEHQIAKAEDHFRSKL